MLVLEKTERIGEEVKRKLFKIFIKSLLKSPSEDLSHAEINSHYCVGCVSVSGVQEVKKDM